MSAAFHVTIPVTVQWSEMDALGHVNNARFFTWFESARIALFERIGVPTSGPSATGPILATTTCDVLRPVVYPATLRVGVRVSRVGETSISMEYEVAERHARARVRARHFRRRPRRLLHDGEGPRARRRPRRRGCALTARYLPAQSAGCQSRRTSPYFAV